MKLAGLVMLFGTAGGGYYVYATIPPIDVYNVPIAQAQARLVEVTGDTVPTIGQDDDPEFAAVTNEDGSVTWSQSGSFTGKQCTFRLRSLPSDAAKTHMMVSCGGAASAPDGVMGGAAERMYRQMITRRADAAVRAIPYEHKKVLEDQIYGWPEQGEDSFPAKSPEPREMAS